MKTPLPSFVFDSVRWKDLIQENDESDDQSNSVSENTSFNSLSPPAVNFVSGKGLKKSRSQDNSPTLPWSEDGDSTESADLKLSQSKFRHIIHRAQNRGRKLMEKKKKREHSSGQLIALPSLYDHPLNRVEAARPGRSSLDVEVADEEALHMNESLMTDRREQEESDRRYEEMLVSDQEIGENASNYRIPFFKARAILASLLVCLSLIFPHFLSGFLWGLYVCSVVFLYMFVSKPIPPRKHINEQHMQLLRSVGREIENRQDQAGKGRLIYKGWMNELKGHYDPSDYDVNRTRSVLVRLDGKILRICRPERNIYRHSLCNESTFRTSDPTMIAQSLYDLTNAEVSLRPKSLAKLRWWSRKYPILIKLASKSSEISTVDARMNRSQSDYTQVTYSEEDENAYEADTSDSEAVDCNLSRDRKSASISESDILSRSSIGRMERSSSDKISGTRLLLFVRSAREKERWFHRLRETCSQYRIEPAQKSYSTSSLPNLAETLHHNRLINNEYFLYVSNSVQFARYMSEMMYPSQIEISVKEGIVPMDLGRCKWTPTSADTKSEIVYAANGIAARIFYDFCRDEYWIKHVRNKLQTKLSAIHLPYFIDTLELSRLELGTATPRIVGVHSPVLNDWGLWTDLELRYHGCLRLGLETKVNVMKLKMGNSVRGRRLSTRYRSHGSSSNHCGDEKRRRYSDEEMPLSPESSPDENFADHKKQDSTPREGAGKKLLSFVDRIANSRHFQAAAELKPVKKVMEGISSTRLMLNVEMSVLEGTLAVNFPPPPSDRVWYGFRHPPKLSLKAVPQVGDRSVEMASLSDWIENKLRQILEKSLVMPNMDDIIVPATSGNDLLKFGYNQ